MKRGNRVFAMLLAVAMVFAYMPAMAFANEEEATAEEPLATEEAVTTEEEVTTEEVVDTPTADSEVITEAPKAKLLEADEPKATVQEAGEDWSICLGGVRWISPSDSGLYAWVTPNSETVELEYQWKRGNAIVVDWTALEDIDEDGDLYDILDATTGSYTFSVRETNNHSQTASAVFTVYECPVIGGLVYYADEDNTAWVEALNDDITGNLVVSPTVAFPDGKTRTITGVFVYSPIASSINIPASVTYVSEEVGQLYDEAKDKYTPIPGFTIFGTTGSAAQTYANNHGITFSPTGSDIPEDPDNPDASNWIADDVESIEFIPAGDPDRFTFYEHSSYGDYYSVYFENGDKIKARLTDGSKKTLEFRDGNSERPPYWWIEEEQKELSELYKDSEGVQHYIGPYMQKESEGWNLGENLYRVWFGTHKASDEYGYEWTEYVKSEPFAVSLLENPVTAITYIPSGTAAEIKERFTFPAGLERYYFPYANGDKLVVAVNGKSKDYVYDEDKESFFSGEEDLPWKYGYLQEEGLGDDDIAIWEAGNDYNVYLTFAGKKTAAIKVHVIEDPVDNVLFEPQRDTYSEAEMRLNEDEEDGTYYYSLDYQPGDKLYVNWIDGTSSEYVYKNEDVEFVDKNGSRLPYSNYLSYWIEASDEFDDHISQGCYKFYASYLGHPAEFNINVTKSTDEELALVEYKMSALEELDDKYEELDWDAYRDAQQDELITIYDKAYDAIYNATSIGAIDAAMAAYDEDVAAVKTAEEMDDEDDDDDALVYQAEYHGTPFFEVGPYGEATLLPEEDETDITDYITVTTTDGEKMDCYFIHDYTDEDNPLKLYDENDNEVGFYAYVENSTAYIELWQPVDTDDIEWEATIEFKNANIDNEVESIVFKPSTIKLFSEDIKRTINGNTYYALRNRAVHSHLDETWRSRFALGDQLIVNYDNGRSKTFTNVDYYDDDSYEWNDGFFNSTRTESILVEMSVDSDTAMIDDELKSGNNKVKVYYHGCSVEINVQVETPESRAEAARIAEEARRAEIARQNEQARQGTFIGGLPKVKISKPKVAKKSVTVKWKKLNKKQLKKGVTNIEVWVCPNGAFGPNDTIMKTTGKKKASLKVKGLAKGTYFVKVRAIKNVGGVKYYSAWSKVKKVKVKK